MCPPASGSSRSNPSQSSAPSAANSGSSVRAKSSSVGQTNSWITSGVPEAGNASPARGGFATGQTKNKVVGLSLKDRPERHYI